MQPEAKRGPWFLTIPAIAVAILLAGPFALPLVWVSGALKRWQKWAVTALMVIFTIWLLKESAYIYQTLLKSLRDLQEVLK